MNNKLREFWDQTLITLGGYLRGQLILMGLTFLILCFGLANIGIEWWGLKAFFIAVFDLLPVLGSGMIMIPWAIIRALTGSAEVGAQIAILYVILVIIRLFAEPLIIGKSIGFSPIITLVITLFAMIILGPAGAIFGGIIAIVLKVFFTVFADKSGSTPSTKKRVSRYDSRSDKR